MKVSTILSALLAFTVARTSALASTCVSALDGGMLELGDAAILVNDDFCDCVDGADEPATSACSHLPTAMFQCRNEGFLAISIHSSRVHDGVCDCCDGTDELQGRCANTCHIEIAKRREQATKELVVLEAGMAERQRRLRDVAAEEGRMAHELATHTAVQRELRGLKLKVQVFLDRESRREYELQVASAKEKELAEGGKCRPAEKDLHPVAAAPPVDATPAPPIATSQPSFSDEADVAAEFKQDKVKRILGHAVVYRQNGNWMSLRAYMHDVMELAKRTPARTIAERKKEDFLGPLFYGGREGQVMVLTGALRGVGLVLSPLRLLVEGIWWAQYYWSQLLHHALPSPVLRLMQQGVDLVEMDWRYQKSLALRRLSQGRFFWWYWYTSWGVSIVWDAPVVAYKYLFPTLDTTVTLPEATSLRQILQDLDHDLARVQNAIDALTRIDPTDYGDCCRILKGTCTVAQFDKYVYKVCPFDAVHQDQTRMGTWKRWHRPDANDTPSPATMVFEDGEKCWSGPSRSARVVLECGPQDKILRVEELSTCTYTIAMATPAACSQAQLDATAKAARRWSHDEL